MPAETVYTPVLDLYRRWLRKRNLPTSLPDEVDDEIPVKLCQSMPACSHVPTGGTGEPPLDIEKDSYHVPGILFSFVRADRDSLISSTELAAICKLPMALAAIWSVPMVPVRSLSRVGITPDAI